MTAMLDHLTWTSAFAALGFVTVMNFGLSFVYVLIQNYVARGVDLSKFGAGTKERYALVTGSTDGIGKEFALQLAARKFNLILVSRTLAKLQAVAKEIKSAHGVDVKVLAVDFAQASQKDYQALEQLVKSVPVGVLVNNVAASHAMPTPFVEESQATLDTIIKINVEATVRITHMVLPQMVERNNGLIINVGSFAGLVPTAYLQTYSGTKAFLKTWSIALAHEVKKQGVHVEHLNTYFVATAMSKIRRSTAMIPTAEAYVKRSLATIGRSFDSVPYPTHNWLAWFMRKTMNEEALTRKTCDMQLGIRRRALLKQEKEAKKN